MRIIKAILWPIRKVIFFFWEQQHRHTTTGQWVYVNHAGRSYLGATFNNSSQNYMHGFGFRPGYATTVWIAIPGLTAQVRDDGKTINIHSAQQQIGQG